MTSSRKSKDLIFILMTILISVNMWINYSSDFSYTQEENLKSSKTSGEIQIFGNSEWEDLKGAGLCTGSGTSSDPYVIEDLEINAGGAGICIRVQDTDVHFKIENCTLSNAGGAYDAGIHFQSVQNGVIIDNEIFNNKVGIFLDPSSIQNHIQGNNIHDNDEWAIQLFQTSDVVISENEIYNNRNGILLDDKSSQNVIENNIMYDNDESINLYGSSHNIIRNNTVNSFVTTIQLTYSDFNKIYDNILSNSVSGIRLDFCDDNKIYKNVLSYFNYAISIAVDSRNQITQNTISYSDCGIYIGERSSCNTISDNIFSNNGIDIYGSQGICLELLLPIVIGIVLLISISIVITILIRRKAHHKKVLKDENGLIIQETHAEEKPSTKKEKVLKEATSTYEDIEEKEIHPIPSKALIESQEVEEIQEKYEIFDDKKGDLETITPNDFLINQKQVDEENIIKSLEQEKEEKSETILVSEEHVKSDSVPMQESELQFDIDINENKSQEIENLEKEIKLAGEPNEEITSSTINMTAEAIEADRKDITEEKEQVHEFQQEEIEKEEIKPVKEKEPQEKKVTEKLITLPTGNLICPYCGFNNPDDASYCLQCGQTIKKRI